MASPLPLRRLANRWEFPNYFSTNSCHSVAIRSSQSLDIAHFEIRRPVDTFVFENQQDLLNSVLLFELRTHTVLNFFRIILWLFNQVIMWHATFLIFDESKDINRIQRHWSYESSVWSTSWPLLVQSPGLWLNWFSWRSEDYLPQLRPAWIVFQVTGRITLNRICHGIRQLQFVDIAAKATWIPGGSRSKKKPPFLSHGSHFSGATKFQYFFGLFPVCFNVLVFLKLNLDPF